MRVLLDENLPLDFAAEISGHQVETVRGRGWTGTENGELMRLAANVCDAFITMDQNLPRHQDIAKLPFGVILLRAPSNRMMHLRPLIVPLLHAIDTITPGEFRQVRRLAMR